MSESLEKNLKWLGISDCKCKYEWKSYGKLYGISMGKGWVRMNTDPACPHHGEAKRDILHD